MEVALSPETDLYTMLVRISAILSQILYVTVQRVLLPVASSVAVIGQHPAERHVVPGIAVDHGAGGEGVIIPFAIERLLDAAIVLLTLHVALPVLHKDPLTRLSGLEPEVAVIGIEVTLEVAKLRYQCGSPCQGIVV